jgi:4'-phosphopantetheinyl transferase
MPLPSATAGVPALQGNDVHAWWVDLSGSHPSDTEQWLTLEEQARAQRFVFDRDQRRFAHAHIALNQLLCAYTGLAVHQLPISLNSHGKPQLPAGLNLGFNLSHSGDCGLIALSRHRHVGVDLELMDDTPRDRHELAASVFTPQEQQALLATPPTQHEHAFLTAWTRKEAVLKALGVGLTMHPNQVHVGITPNRARIPNPAFLQTHSDDTPDAEFLDIATIAHHAKHIACVALATHLDQVDILQFLREP